MKKYLSIFLIIILSLIIFIPPIDTYAYSQGISSVFVYGAGTGLAGSHTFGNNDYFTGVPNNNLEVYSIASMDVNFDGARNFRKGMKVFISFYVATIGTAAEPTRIGPLGHRGNTSNYFSVVDTNVVETSPYYSYSHYTGVTDYRGMAWIYILELECFQDVDNLSQLSIKFDNNYGPLETTSILMVGRPIVQIEYADTTYTSLQALISAINNLNISAVVTAQQQTTNAINNVNSTLNNDSTTDSTNSGSSFFSNFSVNTFGLTSVVTAPLTFINSMTNSCSSNPVTLTLFEKDITLPCGDSIFWGRSDVATFRSIWNVIVGGPIIYMLAIKLFRKVQIALNPDKSEEGGLDL